MRFEACVFEIISLCRVLVDQALNVTERTHSTMTVVVNVEDVNDNFPVFHSRNYISIAEDESIGYPILLIAATDADRNNSIRYSITNGDPENIFSLNRDTGESVCLSVWTPVSDPSSNWSIQSIFASDILYDCDMLSLQV